MNVSISLKTMNGSILSSDKVLSFGFVKDVYKAYTTLNASFVISGADPAQIAEASLIIEGYTLHHGLIDSLAITRSGGCDTAVISSRSFTSLLCQNQLEPGVKYGVSLNELMDNFYPLPYVTHENNTDTSSYIYVEKNTTMWENIVNLGYKLTGGYPYIRGTNCVRITRFPTPQSFSYSVDQLLTSGSAVTGKRLVSDFHMADLAGDYGNYDYEDADVIAAKIVRHKYFDLDMQFLRDPSQALVYHDKDAFRGRNRIFCSYSGYNGEDLSDLVSFGSISAERIAYLRVSGSSSGVITELSVYHDKFYP
ncbi:MAG: hypothetical protein IJK31_00780 [Ruminococcus sp.]|nr:hypothetical protein [Ruminococcus sp.]